MSSLPTPGHQGLRGGEKTILQTMVELQWHKVDVTRKTGKLAIYLVSTDRPVHRLHTMRYGQQKFCDWVSHSLTNKQTNKKITANFPKLIEKVGEKMRAVHRSAPGSSLGARREQKKWLSHRTNQIKRPASLLKKVQ